MLLHTCLYKLILSLKMEFFLQEGDKLRDEDLYKFLLELKRTPSQLKKKCLPGQLVLNISPVRDTPKYCLTPELAKLIPYPGLMLSIFIFLDRACFVIFFLFINLVKKKYFIVMIFKLNLSFV